MLKIRLMLLLTLFCCVCIGCSGDDSDELVPAVRLISGGKGEVTEHLPVSFNYSLEIDEPLDHDLVIALRIGMYDREKIVLGSDSLYFIKKGRISTGRFMHSASVFATRVAITVLPPEDRLREHENGVLVPIRNSANRSFDADKDGDLEDIDFEDFRIDIPVGYSFKPYDVGSPSQINFSF